MSVLQAANVHFDSSGLVRIGKDGSNVVIKTNGGAIDIDGNIISSFGKSLIDDADAAAARTTLGLGTIATVAAPSGTVVGTTDTQTLTNKTLTNPTISDGLVVDTETMPANAIDPTNGLVQSKTLSSSVTFTDSLADGESVVLLIDDGSTYAITWPTITWLSGRGSTPTLQTSGNTVIHVFKVGATLYGNAVNGA